MKQYIILLSLAASGCLLWGCKKQLNVFPTTSEVDGNVITDEQSARTTLNGVYYQFAGAGFDNNSNPSVKWCDIIEMPPSELSGMMTYPYGRVPLADHTYDPTSVGVSTIWTYGYGIVNAANGFLKNIAPVSNIADVTKKQLIAEAKFLRAYANATLLFYYGQYADMNSPYGIILRKKFVDANNLSMPRSSVKDCYDYILADLEDAVNGMVQPAAANYYAGSWAAKLLKARVLMVRGQNGDFGQAASICHDIIANGPYSLEDHSKDIFLSKGLNSNEVILGVMPYDNDIYKYNEYLYYNQAVGTDLMADLFQDDPRKDWVYQPIPNSYMGGDMYAFTKYYPGAADDPEPVDIASVSYAMRLTEAYLLEAEALAAADSSLPEARSLLKTVMQHAGFTDFSQVNAAHTAGDLRVLIIKEEMKNFVGEAGQDWLAARRLPFATLQQLVPSIKTKDQLILPIPQDERKRNNAAKQNPGYGG